MADRRTLGAVEAAWAFSRAVRATTGNAPVVAWSCSLLRARAVPGVGAAAAAGTVDLAAQRGARTGCDYRILLLIEQLTSSLADREGRNVGQGRIFFHFTRPRDGCGN